MQLPRGIRPASQLHLGDVEINDPTKQLKFHHRFFNNHQGKFTLALVIAILSVMLCCFKPFVE